MESITILVLIVIAIVAFLILAFVLKGKTSNSKTVDELLIEIKNIKADLKTYSDKTLISSTAIETEIKNQANVTDKLNATTENLKNLLSNNQQRGQFGEQVADDLLKMSGFVKDVDYYYNKSQEGSGSRPDFTILLPDKVKINVDAKFPLANLLKFFETEDKEAKKNHLKAFETDIKAKIKQVSTRDYINAEDNTVDFVILFIPNEMIFSFIYENMNSIWTEALEKKVIFAGPFGFSATLRLIRQSYDNFKIQSNVHKIVTLIKEFGNELEKYNEEFAKIGGHIYSLTQQYEKVDSTRKKALTKTIEKIKLDEPESFPMLTEGKEQ